MRTPPAPLQARMLNTAAIELWPAGLLRARGNADARVLSRARQVLRRKRDGRYLAAASDAGWRGLEPRWMRATGIDDALDAVEAPLPHAGARDPATLPLHALHRGVGILLGLLLALHIGGAFYHQLILRDGLIGRMAPGFLRR